MAEQQFLDPIGDRFCNDLEAAIGYTVRKKTAGRPEKELDVPIMGFAERKQIVLSRLSPIDNAVSIVARRLG